MCFSGLEDIDERLKQPLTQIRGSRGVQRALNSNRSLPNELLEDIFDYAYATCPPPPMPISKRLLPFHEKQLFRQVSLSSSSLVKKFLRSVSNDEEKGELVKSLELKRKKSFKIKSLEILEKLFPLLPNLQHLGLVLVNIEISSRSKTLFSSLATVTSVSIEAPPNTHGIVDLDYFCVLSAFPSLDTLRVIDWPILRSRVFDEDIDIGLGGVKTLCVEGEGAEDASVVELVALCPALLHLELVTTYDDRTSFSRCLPALPSTLESLKLAATHPSPYFHPANDHLLHFKNLRSLELEDGCYSSTIHSTLQQLPSLEKIRLGGGAISPAGFLPLLCGPARLVRLKIIVLDFYVGQKGIRVKRSSQLPEGFEMKDWKIPQASAKEAENGIEDEIPLRIDQIQHLIEVAGENEVEIEGTIHEALENLEDYWVEKSNRAILSAYNGNDVGFEWLREVRSDAIEAGVTLSILDVDSLDSKRLELVKIDQPGRDWFIFTLRNREDDPSQEIESESESE
ncbi:hypothetical protein JCM5350_006099 [Sporobolomyces pararoseus]